LKVLLAIEAGMPRYNAGSSQDNSNNAAIDAACGFAKGRRGGLNREIP